MSFRFPLAMVLRVRESAERREELHLQRILAEIVRARAAIDEETERIRNARSARDLVLRKTEPPLAYELQSLAEEAAAAADRRTALEERLTALEQQRLAQMKSYELAHRDRQMLSDMAADQREQFELKQARVEQKVLDDIFAARSRMK